jgi:hypothetical protein
MNPRSKEFHRWLRGQADAAFKASSRKLIERAAQAGEPILTWRDGHVVRLSPEKLLPAHGKGA